MVLLTDAFVDVPFISWTWLLKTSSKATKGMAVLKSAPPPDRRYCGSARYFCGIMLFMTEEHEKPRVCESPRPTMKKEANGHAPPPKPYPPAAEADGPTR